VVTARLLRSTRKYTIKRHSKGDFDDNATVNKPEQMKGRRYNYLIAFAFGCGVAFGAAIST
jgi:hypothetical protein